MVGLLLRALLAALALLAQLGGDPAYAQTSTGVSVDVATAPTLKEAQLVGTSSDFSQLVTRGYTIGQGAEGAEFQRLIAQPVSNAGLRGATMDLVETIAAPVAELGTEAAALCFANPVVCLGTAAVGTYLTSKLWQYQPVPPSVTPVWTKPSNDVLRSCSLTTGFVTQATCFAAAQSATAAFTPNPSLGCGGPASIGVTTEIIGTDANGPTIKYHLNRNNISGALSSGCSSTASWSGNASTGIGAPRVGSQVEMASDIQSAGDTYGQTTDKGYATLAQQLISAGQPLPIDGTATATLNPTQPSVAASSSATNPDGSTTTTTDTYSANCTAGAVNAAQCVFNSTTSNGTTTTTTNNTATPPAASDPNAAQASKQCGDATGDACFVKPTDSFTPPALGDAKTFQQSMTDFWTAIQSSPIATAASGVTIGGGTCPTYTLDIPLFGRSYVIDAQCTIASSISAELRTIMIAVWLVVAAGIFLRA